MFCVYVTSLQLSSSFVPASDKMAEGTHSGELVQGNIRPEVQLFRQHTRENTWTPLPGYVGAEEQRSRNCLYCRLEVPGCCVGQRAATNTCCGKGSALPAEYLSKKRSPYSCAALYVTSPKHRLHGRGVNSALCGTAL